MILKLEKVGTHFSTVNVKNLYSSEPELRNVGCKASQSTPSATQIATQKSIAQQAHPVRIRSPNPLHRYSEHPNEAPSSQKLLPLGTVWQQSHRSRSTWRVPGF